MTLRERWARAQTPAALLGAFALLTALLMPLLGHDTGLWDWDTYGRLQFLRHYQPERWLDTHVLYHSAALALMALGLRDVTALVALTAGGAAAFLVLLGWLCRREGLAWGPTALVLAAASVGSPGLVALCLLLEDNVLYLPAVLGLFALALQVGGEVEGQLRRGVVMGLLLAVAMLINVSLLVLAFPLALAPLQLRTDRARAVRMVAALATAVTAYYAAHVAPFTHAKVALDEFLPRALRLQDFHQSSTPLLSLARLEQYLGGLRAMALTPDLHLMRPPPRLYAALLGPLPEFLLALALCLAGWVLLYRWAELKAALRARLDLLGLLGVALAFPYLYEPYLIERWDVAWVGALVGLVALLKARPTRFPLAVVGAMLALQGAGTVITVVHHAGRAWADPAFLQSRAIAQDIRARGADPVVLPFTTDRLLLADFVHHLGGATVYLVRDDGDALACFRLVDLIEISVEQLEPTQALRAGRSVYVDPALSPHVRQQLGLGP